MTSRSCYAFACLIALALPVMAGCGKGGVQRNDLSGTITFEGKPVPEGTIAFEPVEGEVGGGFALIRDGKYDTSQDGRGHLAGKTRVTINGNTGEYVEPDNPDSGTIPLFPSYETTVDLPEGSTTMDFEVPAGT